MSTQGLAGAGVLLVVLAALIRHGRRTARPATRAQIAARTRRRAGLRFVGDMLAGAVHLVACAAVVFGPRTRGRH